MADQIWMRFGLVGQMGLEMRQVVGFRDQSTGGGYFGNECVHHIVTTGEFVA